MRCKKLIFGMLAAALVAAGPSGDVVVKAAENTIAIASANAGNYTINEETSAITKYAGTEKNVVIPDKVNEIPVEVIGTEAFASNPNLETVTVQPGVVLIEEGAFLNCPNLKSIVLPKGVEGIEKLSFFMCKNLESIKVKSGLTCIETNAFYGCANLKEVTLPNTLTDIEDYTFMGCSSLTRVAIPNGVNYIGTGAFMDCTSLKEISIPNTVKDMDEDILKGTSAVIVCEKDSAAYRYALENNIGITLVDKVENFTVDEPDPTKVPDEEDEEEIEEQTVYTIKYALKGGSLSGAAVNEYDGSYSIRLPKATRKEYSFVGWYEGEKKVTVLTKGSKGDKVLTARWEKVKKPSKPVISSIQNLKTKKMSVKLRKKDTGVAGFEMMYATNKKFTKDVKKVRFADKSKTVKKLKKGKTYYVKVRAYKLDSTNNKVYGSYSAVKKVTIKK